MNYLLLEKAVRLALAVGLDAANVVGRRAMQNLQKLLQGGLQEGDCGSDRLGLPAHISWALVSDSLQHPQGSSQLGDGDAVRVLGRLWDVFMESKHPPGLTS